MKRSLIISLLVVSILLVFTLQNQQQVSTVRFLFWEISQTFIVIISLVLGFLLGISVLLPSFVKKNRKIDDLNSFIDSFREKERKKVEENEEENLKDE